MIHFMDIQTELIPHACKHDLTPHVLRTAEKFDLWETILPYLDILF